MIEDIISEIFLEFEVELDKAVDYLKTEYQIMRAGRANPHVLDKIMINYYDTMTPINQLANISVQDARMIVISVWDTAIVKDITKAIATSDIGINPSDDGKIIRMVFPSLTQERRVEMTKVLKKLAEDAKITCRNARRDCLEELKKLKKNSEISEDMYASLEKDVQKTLDPYIEKIDRMQSEKRKGNNAGLMLMFEIKDVIGFTLENAEKILRDNGFTKIIYKIYSSSKVKKTDTLVVVNATKNKNNIELLLGEFLYNIE